MYLLGNKSPETPICKHEYVSTMTKKQIYAKDNLTDDGEPWHQGEAKCKKCGTYGDRWFCIDSPTKMCQYEENEDGDYDTEECIHCGMPEERK